MKNIILFALLLFTGLLSCTAQINELTVDELEGIKFNTITLGDIMEINGDDRKAEALFGKGNYESNINETCPFYCKYYRVFDNKISFEFEGSSGTIQTPSGETINDVYFARLFLKDPAIKVTVKDVTASLGDDIGVFKDYKINEEHHFVSFLDEDTATIDITFSFDPATRKITKITMDTY